MAGSTNGVFQRINQVVRFLTEAKEFDRVLGKIRLVTASPGKVSCELTVEKEHSNSGGTLHGGMTATIVDTISTLAIVSNDCPPGVSTDLNVSYLRAAKIGETVTINAECTKSGRTLAFTKVDLINKETGKLIAQGRHTKFIGEASIDTVHF